MNQKIFKRSFVGELRDKVRSGESLGDYFKRQIEYPADSELESSIKVDAEKIKLRFKGKRESAANDIDNAIAIYESFPELNETQASDPRLWVYLTHVTMRDYVLARWPIAGSCQQVSLDSNAKAKAVNHILSHWFASGGDRILRRNALARLWWPVHLTVAVWEKDDFFVDLKSKDLYRFTRVLLSTQDVYQQVLERGFGRDNKLLITILEFIEAHSGLTRQQIRNFMKEMNLELSVKNFAVLSRPQMKKAIFEIGEQAIALFGSEQEEK
jgi:hypothetical protein